MKKSDLITIVVFASVLFGALILNKSACRMISYKIRQRIELSKNSISNPENSAFVVEIAFNEGIDVNAVTQEMFNTRYSK